ncbi:MAG: hypothetical protein IJJ47_03465 [Methanosphaera sp.]|nr:hypothetical protein [Methanosphaera sp.]
MNKTLMKSIKNSEIEAKMKLKLDKNINELLAASEKTGIPLTFRGDRIIDFKVINNDKNEHFIPDQIVFSPPAILLNFKLGTVYYKEIPFDRKIISDEIVIFDSTFYADLDIKLKLRFKMNNHDKTVTLNITINPKSDKIEDILNYEIRKKNISNTNFIIQSPGNEYKFEGFIPEGKYDDSLIKFFQKVNYINDKLNLDLRIDEDYIINNDDYHCANNICKYIKGKKIPIKNISITMETNLQTLRDFISDKREIILEQNLYMVQLLGNEINLGSCKVVINNYEILNEEELIDIIQFNEKNNNEYVSFTAVLKEQNSDELYLDFN